VCKVLPADSEGKVARKDGPPLHGVRSAGVPGLSNRSAVGCVARQKVREEGGCWVSNYKRGRSKEYDVAKILEKAGYEVLRTAGSHGFADVIAVGPTGVRFIQVKRVQEGGIWKAEYEAAKERLQQLPRFASISYEVWVWEDGKGFVIQEAV